MYTCYKPNSTSALKVSKDQLRSVHTPLQRILPICWSFSTATQLNALQLKLNFTAMQKLAYRQQFQHCNLLQCKRSGLWTDLYMYYCKVLFYIFSTAETCILYCLQHLRGYSRLVLGNKPKHWYQDWNEANLCVQEIGLKNVHIICCSLSRLSGLHSVGYISSRRVRFLSRNWESFYWNSLIFWCVPINRLLAFIYIQYGMSL